MEITPKRYWRRWRRRGYEKIDGSSKNRVKKDPNTTRKKRSWRIKISKKLRIFKTASSAKKILVWIRDSYVKMMMRLANSRAVGSSGYGGGSGFGFGSGPMKEYDEKMLVEIYKTILMAQAQGKLVDRDAVDNNNNNKPIGSGSEPPVISVTPVVTC